MSKPQSKTEKKLDGKLCRALTDVCENHFKAIDGFEWLTHQANYTNFPASLLITCVFSDEAQRQQAEAAGECARMNKIIQAKLLRIGVRFKALDKQVIYDSEEACTQAHDGNWDKRLASRAQRAVLKKPT